MLGWRFSLDYIFKEIYIHFTGIYRIFLNSTLEPYKNMNPFFIIYCIFYQPSEAFCAAMGMQGADALGLHIAHGTLENDDGVFKGRLGDVHGTSEISNVVYEPEQRFEFDKQYMTQRNRNIIRYELIWDVDHGWWTGVWNILSEDGRSIDSGKARIHLIPSSIEFFQINM